MNILATTDYKESFKPEFKVPFATPIDREGIVKTLGDIITFINHGWELAPIDGILTVTLQGESNRLDDEIPVESHTIKEILDWVESGNYTISSLSIVLTHEEETAIKTYFFRDV